MKDENVFLPKELEDMFQREKLMKDINDDPLKCMFMAARFPIIDRAIKNKDLDFICDNFYKLTVDQKMSVIDSFAKASFICSSIRKEIEERDKQKEKDEKFIKDRLRKNKEEFLRTFFEVAKNNNDDEDDSSEDDDSDGSDDYFDPFPNELG